MTEASTASPATAPVRCHRNPGLDALRGLAVVAMMATHAVRIVPCGPRRSCPAGGDPSEDAALIPFRVLLDWEPAISATFLFAVGAGLAFSRARTSDYSAWLARQARRAGALYLISVGLFLLHFGPQFPDALVAPDILSVIAVAILAVAGFLRTRRGWGLTGLVLAPVVLARLLEATQHDVPGLHAGPGAIFPVLSLAASGAVYGLVLTAPEVSPDDPHDPDALDAAISQRGTGLSMTVLASVTSLGFLSYLLRGDGWTTLNSRGYAVYDGEVAVVAWLTGGAARPVDLAFWNHTAAATGPLTAIVAGLALGARALAFTTVGRRLIAPAALVGRHALVVYIAHLIALGLLDATSLAPTGGVGAAIITVGLAAAAITYGWVREGQAVG